MAETIYRVYWGVDMQAYTDFKAPRGNRAAEKRQRYEARQFLKFYACGNGFIEVVHAEADYENAFDSMGEMAILDEVKSAIEKRKVVSRLHPEVSTFESVMNDALKSMMPRPLAA